MAEMNKISLEEDKANNITDIINEYVSEFSNYSDIDCIFCTPYRHNYHGIYGKLIITLTLLCQDKTDETIRNRAKELNQGNTLKSSYGDGVDVVIRLDESSNYVFNPSNAEDVKKISRLYNSVIVYDRYGNYTRLQTMISNLDSVSVFDNYNPNLCQFDKTLKLNFK